MCPGLRFSSRVTGLHVGLLGRGRRWRVREGGNGVTWAIRVLQRTGHVIPVFPSNGVLFLGQELTKLKKTKRCKRVRKIKALLIDGDSGGETRKCILMRTKKGKKCMVNSKTLSEHCTYLRQCKTTREWKSKCSADIFPCKERLRTAVRRTAPSEQQ